jgi:hypothetical protein
MLLSANMETAIVSVRAKREYVQVIYQRYRAARRPEKQRILDEFCQVAGYHRKHAIRLLNGPTPGAPPAPRRRAALYGPAVIEALRAIWAAAGYPWSVRLKALLPLWLPWAAPTAPAAGRGAAVAGDEPAADRSPPGPGPPPAHQAALSPHQPRHAPQAPFR